MPFGNKKQNQIIIAVVIILVVAGLVALLKSNNYLRGQASGVADSDQSPIQRYLRDPKAAGTCFTELNKWNTEWQNLRSWEATVRTVNDKINSLTVQIEKIQGEIGRSIKGRTATEQAQASINALSKQISDMKATKKDKSGNIIGGELTLALDRLGKAQTTESGAQNVFFQCYSEQNTSTPRPVYSSTPKPSTSPQPSSSVGPRPS